MIKRIIAFVIAASVIQITASAKEVFFFEDFSQQNTICDIRASNSTLIKNTKDGILEMFYAGMTYPSVNTAEFVQYDADKIVVEFSLNHKFEKSRNTFVVQTKNLSYELFAISNMPEWTLYSVLIDFENKNAKLFADGVLQNECSIAFSKSDAINFKISVFLLSSGCQFDYISIYSLRDKAMLSLSENTPVKVSVKSDIPLMQSKIQNITIDGANIKKIVPKSMHEFEIYFNEPLEKDRTYLIDVSKLRDIYDRSVESNISLKFQNLLDVKAFNVTQTEDGYSICCNIYNNSEKSQMIDLISGIYESGILKKSVVNTLNLSSGLNEYTLNIPVTDVNENFEIKNFLWESFEKMTIIENL